MSEGGGTLSPSLERSPERARSSSRTQRGFRSRREASVVIETWRQHYNEVRPHSSLQYLTPAEFKQQLRQDLQPAIF